MNPTNNGLQQVAEIELIYKRPVKQSDRIKVSSSDEINQIVRPFYDTNIIELREEFKIVLVDRGNYVLGVVPIAVGTSTNCLIDIKFIVTAAAKANADGVVLCHNHPSGSLKPSRSDIELTKRVKAALGLVDIVLLDHIILTSETYYSFADDNIL